MQSSTAIKAHASASGLKRGSRIACHAPSTTKGKPGQNRRAITENGNHQRTIPSERPPAADASNWPCRYPVRQPPPGSTRRNNEKGITAPTIAAGTRFSGNRAAPTQASGKRPNGPLIKVATPPRSAAAAHRSASAASAAAVAKKKSGGFQKGPAPPIPASPPTTRPQPPP